MCGDNILHHDNTSMKCIPTPHFHIVKLGFTGVYIFYFLLQNVDHEYSLEPPHPRALFLAKNRKISHFSSVNYHNDF